MAKGEQKVKKQDDLKEQEQIEIVDDSSTQDNLPPTPEQQISFAQGIAPYLAFLEGMRVVKKSIDTAPTFTPKNFFEQIQFYDNSGTYRLYLYVNGDWRYVALT